ncbi:MAG: peptide chain release factor 1 [Gammaproteobacteria bacterium]|nr:peptide chain release factor 1 [Gammaproteobacteria bacterium]MYC25631.1 peptide chain release factor 1 [Gammaproteobacteria bacterium]
MPLAERIVQRLEECADRYVEIQALLGDPDVVDDKDQFKSLSQEYSELEPIVNAYEKLRTVEAELESTRELLNSQDGEMRLLAEDEIEQLSPLLDEAVSNVEKLLLPTDPDDTANVYLEIRAGTGGDEAALFAGDLVKMYERYAQSQGWIARLVSVKPTPQGGFKEAIFRISGNEVFSRLKFESGVHRVQRIPITESQGRVHTSACTVAILPEIEELTEVEVKDSDLRIDTYRASGAGGQHVNKTDSAVRITHLPTGVVAECQEERSQHQNKERALALIKSRLLNEKKRDQEQARTQDRKLQVGSGDRSERIRTYNFPQGRLTDHRVGLTLYKLDEILAGSLDQVIDPLVQVHQADLLRELRLEDSVM